jgi:hypothetical protein
MTEPVVGLRWNAAGWWGGLVGGGVGWIVLVAGEILLRTQQGWASLLALLVAATLAATGVLLWRLRSTVTPAAGGLVFLLGCFPAAVGAFALRELAGLADFPFASSGRCCSLASGCRPAFCWRSAGSALANPAHAADKRG